MLTINPKGGKIDDVSDTDGIRVTSCPTSKQFPRGRRALVGGCQTHLRDVEEVFKRLLSPAMP